MDVMALQVQLVVLSIAKYFTNIANIFKIFSKQFANILQVMQIFCEWMWVELYLLHRAGHLIVYQATLLKSLTLKKNTHTLDCWSKIKSQKSNTEYQKISMGVLLPFIRARLTIQCDSWTSAKPDGGKTMPSKLEQTDKGTPFSCDFPTIIFDTFLTWNMLCFSKQCLQNWNRRTKEHLYLVIFPLLSLIHSSHELYHVFSQTMPTKLEQTDKGKLFLNCLTLTQNFFLSYWIYDIVSNQGHL